MRSPVNGKLILLTATVFLLPGLTSCAVARPDVEPPRGAGWELERQGFHATMDSASSTTTTSRQGNRVVQTTTTTQVHSERAENLQERATSSSDDVPRTLQVGANVREFQFGAADLVTEGAPR